MERIFMSDLAARLAELTGMSKRKAQLFMSAIVETIQEGINNDKMVKIKDRKMKDEKRKGCALTRL